MQITINEVLPNYWIVSGDITAKINGKEEFEVFFAKHFNYDATTLKEVQADLDDLKDKLNELIDINEKYDSKIISIAELDKFYIQVSSILDE